MTGPRMGVSTKAAERRVCVCVCVYVCLAGGFLDDTGEAILDQ